MPQTRAARSRLPLTAPRLALVLTLIAGMAQAQDIIRAHGISTFGDLALPEGFTHLPYVNPEAPKGGEISEGLVGGYDSFNPYTVRGRADVWASHPLESLMDSTADEMGAAYCLLCDSIEYPPSRDWVIFHLRPEAKFSDGTPVTADDVLFSHEQLRDKGLSSYRSVINQVVETVTVIDDHTIRFDFKPDWPRRDIIQTIGGTPVFSRKDFEANGFDLGKSTTRPFLGSGPYVLASHDMGRQSVWQRNPDYWGNDVALMRGRANFDTVRFEYFGDDTAAFESFKTGVFTFRQEVSSLGWATGYDFPAVAKGWIVRAALPKGTKAQAQGFVFNLQRPQFSDLRVRQAIALMFNFEWSNATLFYQLYHRVNGFWDNSPMQATGPTPEDEAAILEPVAQNFPPGLLTDEAVMAPTSGERQLDRANLRRAAALMEEAGWAIGPDGLRHDADGNPLRLEIVDDSRTFERIITPFIENLRVLGVDARFTLIDDAQMAERRSRHDYDMMVASIMTDLLPSSDLAQVFRSESADDVFNPMALTNPGVDILVDQVIAAKTREEMELRTRALDRALRSLQIWVPQYYSADWNVAYWDQYQHPEAMPPYALGELDFWWFDADKAARLKEAGALR